MSPDELVVDVEDLAERADLVLEQLAKGLDQLQLHVLEETADVVVGFDGGAGPLERDGLDDIGVEGALQQELDGAVARGCRLLVQLEGFGLKHLDKSVADDLSLLLGVGDLKLVLAMPGK